MKSFYYYLCGVMTVLTMLLFTVDIYGREFLQDYWIEQLWHGKLEIIYRIITNIIIFVDCILIYFAGFLSISKSNSINN